MTYMTEKNLRYMPNSDGQLYRYTSVTSNYVPHPVFVQLYNVWIDIIMYLVTIILIVMSHVWPTVFLRIFVSCLSTRTSDVNEEMYTSWMYRNSGQYVLASNCRALG